MANLNAIKAFNAGREQARKEYCQTYFSDVYDAIKKQIVDGRVVKIRRSRLTYNAYLPDDLIYFIVSDVNEEAKQNNENYSVSYKKKLFRYELTIHVC